MNQPNPESSSPLAADVLAKRKRGRPRKDEAATPLENSPVTPKPGANQSEDTDMVGQVVSGVVEGSFEAGYFLNVKIKDTNKQLKGVVFLPGKVTPITPANDVAPYAKMHGREDISIPSSAQQQTQSEKETNKQPETDRTTLIITDNKNQTESSMASLTHDHPMKDAITDSLLPPSNPAYETPMKDISGLKIPNPTLESQALPLMPQASNDQVSEQGNAVVHGQEAANADTSTDKDVVMAATRLVEFFPTPETIQKEAMGTSLFQKETDQQKSPRGFNLTEKPAENVPEELQLELGNKTMTGDNITTAAANTTAITTETNPQTTASKSGFLANLFVGEATGGFSVKNVDGDKEVAKEEATS